MIFVKLGIFFFFFVRSKVTVKTYNKCIYF
jgi:hypothetical protein